MWTDKTTIEVPLIDYAYDPSSPSQFVPVYGTPRPVSGFVPLVMPTAHVDGEIRIELLRAGTTVKIVWPAAASRDCAT